jgi:hypothetical protein
LITVEKKSLPEVQSGYRSIFESTFGQYTYEGNYPSEIYLGYDDGKLVGFIAGRTQAPHIWYMQRAGFFKDEQGSIRNYERTAFAINIIHNEYPYIMTIIKNDDIKALKMAMKLGFTIIGVRQDTVKSLWIEMIRGRN